MGQTRQDFLKCFDNPDKPIDCREPLQPTHPPPNKKNICNLIILKKAWNPTTTVLATDAITQLREDKRLQRAWDMEFGAQVEESVLGQGCRVCIYNLSVYGA